MSPSRPNDRESGSTDTLCCDRPPDVIDGGLLDTSGLCVDSTQPMLLPVPLSSGIVPPSDEYAADVGLRFVAPPAYGVGMSRTELGCSDKCAPQW